MSLKYHPDKPNGDNDMFLKLHEAYETLYDDDKRKLYNLKLLFKDIDLSEDDYNMMFSYYNRFVESKEYIKISTWLFCFSEYSHILLMSILIVILFLGGWHPILDIYPLNKINGFH